MKAANWLAAPHLCRPALGICLPALGIWLAALAALALSACGGMTGGDSGPVLVNKKNVGRLQGRQWELKTITVDGTRVIMHPDGVMTIAFAAQGEVGGLGTVNQFRGRYEFSEDGRLTWPAPGLVSTRKAGPPELMDKERAYLAGLPKTSRAIVTKSALQLQSDDGNTVLTFVPLGT
ncbi:MAG TPA: META domain-containing protein [Burkholderiales bacterium]|nr:META domain-containing protein [Burkholderiales bacterium]